MEYINDKGTLLLISCLLSGCFWSELRADELNARLLSDYTVEQDSTGFNKLDEYYRSVDGLIGNNPDSLPYQDANVVVRNGATVTSLAGKYATDGMDVVHFAAALYMINPDVFEDGDVNKIKKGKELRLPSVLDLHNARPLFEELLSTKKKDESTGLTIYNDPIPKAGSTWNIRKQAASWKKLSDGDFKEPIFKDDREIIVPAGDYKSGGGKVRWSEFGLPKPLKRRGNSYDRRNVESVGSVWAVEENARYSDTVLGDEHVVERATVDWQNNTSFTQIDNPAKTGSFYISAPIEPGEFSENAVSSRNDYDPFSSKISWEFPEDILVGEAIRYVADYMGYDLLVDEAEVSLIYSRSLPVVHRKVEMISSYEALAMLGGRGLVVVPDHTVRVIKHSVHENGGAGEANVSSLTLANCTKYELREHRIKVRMRIFAYKQQYDILTKSDGTKCVY